jgi:hypothetical protein
MFLFNLFGTSKRTILFELPQLSMRKETISRNMTPIDTILIDSFLAFKSDVAKDFLYGVLFEIAS